METTETTLTIEDRVRQAEEASRRVWDNLPFPKPGIEDQVRYADQVGIILARREGMIAVQFESTGGFNDRFLEPETVQLIYVGELVRDRNLAGGRYLWEWKD